MNKVQLKEYIKKSILEGEYLEDDPEAMDAMDDMAIGDYEEEEAEKFALDSENPLEEAKVTPDNHVAFLSNALETVWKLGKGNNPVNYVDLAQTLVNDMFSEEPTEEAAIPEVVKRANRIVESWNYKKKSLLTEGADLSTQVTNWKELDRYGEEILVITADGKKEKFTLSDIDESELSYEYNFDDTKAYLTYHNADKSKTLGMTSQITGSPDSPEGYDELELDYLTDNTGKLSEGMHGGYIELMEMNPKFDEGLEMVLEVWNEWKSGQMTEPEMIDEAREDLLSYLSSVLR